MADMAVKCLPRTGSKGPQAKDKPGTTFTAQTSPPVGSPLLAVCLLPARVPVRQKRSLSKVRWTAEQRSAWEGLVDVDKALDPRDYPTKV